MDNYRNEVLRYVEENDVKFIRLTFCDIHGAVKNISLLSDGLEAAFEEGVPFACSGIDGFADSGDSYLRLFPDPKTLSSMPWRPQQGKVIRLFCDIKNSDGTPYVYDVRRLLKASMQRLTEMGFGCSVGLECEFYLFETGENGEPTKIPQDKAGFLDIAPLDKGENVRREICLSLEEMGLKPVSSHHEKGPGQNEIDFKRRNAFKAAENCVLFKSTVQTIAATSGLFASFCPKPLDDSWGNGLSLQLMLTRNGAQAVTDEEGNITPEAAAFTSGILKHAAEITSFTNSSVKSYHRFGSCEAPAYIAWSRRNYDQCVRISALSRDVATIDLRWPDSTCNPFLALTLLLEAGMEGIRNGYTLPQPFSAEERERFDRLPGDLNTAVKLSKNSDFISNTLPTGLAGCYLDGCMRSWEQYAEAEDKEQYFMEIFRTM